MSSRRKFLISTSTAAALPAAAAMLAVSSNAWASDALVSDAELQRQMLGKLTVELNDSATANTEAPYLQDIFFSWDLPSIPVAQIGSIVAYSFGDRPAASGASSTGGTGQSQLPQPGPINEEIADAVHQLVQSKPVMVYAQWEVASVLASKYQMSSANLQSVKPPTVASNGTISYPALDDVAAAIIALQGTAAALGTVAVVTHRDQAKRAIQTSRAHGMNAYAAQGVTLPVDYDAQASQPVNRRRDLYLLNDMMNQFATLRTNLIAQQYPNG
ncbi:hypothetical protein R69927_00944 [Paraburkholderia domus]|uniref:Tat pathway signal protein n=1 Tax=Paraburkholderia domus TaxID=2793075 RepID=A0A9N8MKF7_9BURK|nr:hypothetical protein [Paraburkholderia domus]MBK5085283.1 hypothetical protein [Burkholderia sp. R-69927]MBK5118350.1 hypothetical protein [Burkholderia sp. R-69980]MBK5164187.1 hypothetical protein [Burkholderia sp. R-70211]MBK5179775.1 hypothetical protein [Burkholderia sp. R-69749]MCI0144437.1 hypothetical protein [Paraburkholderia sediminicola]